MLQFGPLQPFFIEECKTAQLLVCIPLSVAFKKKIKLMKSRLYLQTRGLPAVLGGAVLQLEIERGSVTGETLGVEPPHQHRHGLLASHQGVLCVIELSVDVLLRAVGGVGCGTSSRKDS